MHLPSWSPCSPGAGCAAARETRPRSLHPLSSLRTAYVTVSGLASFLRMRSLGGHPGGHPQLVPNPLGPAVSSQPDHSIDPRPRTRQLASGRPTPVLKAAAAAAAGP